MKKIILFLCLITLFFSSCVTLKPTTVTRNASLDGYKYVYITPTSEKTSVSGAVVGGKYGVYGATDSQSTNPADVISGYFIKKGFIRLPDINPNIANQTIIVNYGETGIRGAGFSGYAIEITLQLISAETNEVICVGVAEGCGNTEADDVRIAINRCLEEIFK